MSSTEDADVKRVLNMCSESDRELLLRYFGVENERIRATTERAFYSNTLFATMATLLFLGFFTQNCNESGLRQAQITQVEEHAILAQRFDAERVNHAACQETVKALSQDMETVRRVLSRPPEAP